MNSDNIEDCSQNASDDPASGDPPKLTDEEQRLVGSRPLATILKLSVGPLISQITGAFYGIVTTIWVSKAIGTEGMSAVSLMNCFDGLGRSFGFFIGTAGASQISYLIGQKKINETGQLIADYIRISIILGIIVASILIPCLKPAARWFGAEEKIVNMGFQYMLPLSICIFSTCFFIGVGGCLQGEGRSFFFGMVNLGAIICNMLVFNPLFLFGFKTGIVGAGVSNALAEGIPGIVLIIMYFRGKFNVKPEFNMLFKKFSPYTLASLKVGISQLVANLSLSLPSILVRKFLGNKTKDDFDDVMAGYNVGVRIGQLGVSVMVAITSGYLPAGSYANAAKMPKRFMRLFFHSIWLNLAWAVLISTLAWAIPLQIGKIFSSANKNYLKYCKKLVRIMAGFSIFQAIRFNGQIFFQSLQRGLFATVLSLVNNFVTITVFAIIFYYIKTDNKLLVVYSYPASYIMAAIISICVIIYPSYQIIKSINNDNNNSDDNDDNDDKVELSDISEKSNADENLEPEIPNEL